MVPENDTKGDILGWTPSSESDWYISSTFILPDKFECSVSFYPMANGHPGTAED